MSGIYGFNYKTANGTVLEQAADRLDQWNSFYGHSDHGRLILGHAGLGCHVEHFSPHFPSGRPVMRTGEAVAVIDALLYNRDELLEQLHIQDDKLSDEDLLIQLIREKGFDALSMVNGDFAGAFYEPELRKWTLFRDHMGVRPLYYYLDSERFAFSTDIRALLALPGADVSLNELALYHRVMGYNDLTLCGTDYKYIHCIPPASSTVVTDTKEGYSVEPHTYWRLKQRKIRFRTKEDYQDRLRWLVTDAVRRRLDAVPGIVGGELSGGLDSGVIDILINRLGREGRFYSWSWGTDEIPIRDGDDERKIIFDICKQENISCTFAIRNVHSVMDQYLETVAPPFINTQNLSEGSAILKAQGANVVFTGHGGDEGVSHRCDVFELLYNREYFHYFKQFWHSTKGCSLRLIRTIKRGLLFAMRESKYYTIPYENTSANSRIILKDTFRERMEPRVSNTPLYFSFAPEKYVEQGGTRVRLDNVAFHGAINGVRYMIPFVDPRVMDFAVSIPRYLYLNGKVNRYIYREAFKDLLPESLYTIQYKDTSSLRGFKPDANLRNTFHETISFLSARLDRTYWKDILDFSAIEELKLPEDYTLAQYRRMALVRHELLRCLLIQNAGQNAGKWCEHHE